MSIQTRLKNFISKVQHVAKQDANLQKHSFILFSTLTLYFFVTGCAAFRPNAIADLNKYTPEQILEKVAANHDQIHSLDGKGLLVVEMPGNAFQGNATIKVLHRDSLFIKAEAAFGIDVGYFFANRRAFAHYSPFENTLYRGPIEKVNKLILFQMKITYDELLTALLGTLKFDMTPETIVNIESNQYIFTQKRQENWLTIYVDPGKFVITQAELKDEEGNLLVREEFKFFRNINGIWFAKSIRVHKLDSNERLTINYSKMELNRPISPDNFNFKVPRDARRYRLK